MTIDQMRNLWDLAGVIHCARRDLAWGKTAGHRREPWPAFDPNYTHSPIAYVDLALAAAEAVVVALDLRSYKVVVPAP